MRRNGFEEMKRWGRVSNWVKELVMEPMRVFREAARSMIPLSRKVRMFDH